METFGIKMPQNVKVYVKVVLLGNSFKKFYVPYFISL